MYPLQYTPGRTRLTFKHEQYPCYRFQCVWMPILWGLDSNLCIRTENVDALILTWKECLIAGNLFTVLYGVAKEFPACVSTLFQKSALYLRHPTAIASVAARRAEFRRYHKQCFSHQRELAVHQSADHSMNVSAWIHSRYHSSHVQTRTRSLPSVPVCLNAHQSCRQHFGTARKVSPDSQHACHTRTSIGFSFDRVRMLLQFHVRHRFLRICFCAPLDFVVWQPTVERGAGLHIHLAAETLVQAIASRCDTYITWKQTWLYITSLVCSTHMLVADCIW